MAAATTGGGVGCISSADGARDAGLGSGDAQPSARVVGVGPT